jgi:hypothetical protein
MFLNTIKWAAVVAIAAGFAFTSAVVLGQPQAQPESEVKKAEVKQVQPPDEVGPPQAAELKKQEIPAEPAPQKSGRKTITLDGRIVERNDREAQDLRSRRILIKLEELIPMHFAVETPLDDVLKYIKQATTTPTFSGIPIYVDPIGLQEAERSLNSTVQMDLDGVPLRRTLQLMLTQLGLAYFVEDGMLVVTSEDRAREPLPPPIATPAPIAKMIEKSERGELTSTELKELIEVIKLRRQVKTMHQLYDAPYSQGGGGGGGADRFPGEENITETEQLLNEVRELIRLLKADQQARRGAEPAPREKPDHPKAER